MRNRSFLTSMIVGLVGGLFDPSLITTASAQDETLFKGKRVESIVVSATGGGTDQAARLVGRFLQKHLPGRPDMVYRNMPTGHGVAALNYFANKVKPNGLTWVGGSSSQVAATTLAKEAVEYNPTKFEFFAGVSRGGSIILLRKEKLKNLTDKSLPQTVVGEVDGNRTWGQMIMWGADILGWNIRFVVGYPSGWGPISLAARRGEIDMVGTGSVQQIEDMLATGDFVAVAQDGVTVDGKALGRKDFPDVPVFQNMVQGKLTGIAAETYEFWSSGAQMDKWYALPAGTPKEYVEAYRETWKRIVADPEFVKAGNLEFGEDFLAVSGDDVGNLIRKGAYPRKEITAYFESLKIKYGLPVQPLRDDEIAKLAKERGLVAESPKVTAVLKAVNGDGRQVVFTNNGKDETLEVSSSRSNVSVAGKKAGRNDLKAGMNCEIAFNGKDVDAITCQ